MSCLGCWFWFGLVFPFFFLCFWSLSCVSLLASWLNLRPALSSSPWVSSWIMLKGVRFTTTWLRQSCTSTIWRGSYPSSSHPLNMKTLCLRHISALNVQLPGACTPCSFANIRAPSNHGVTWRHPVPHGDQS